MDMNYNDLSAEQKARMAERSTPEELLELAKGEGYELSDEELELIAGGGAWDGGSCPKCGSYLRLFRATGAKCLSCGYDEKY